MIGLAAAAAVLIFAAGSKTALAHPDGPDHAFMLSYYSNAHTTSAPDATLRLVNDGVQGDSSPAGDVCASTYVFDNNEQLIECCSCNITPNGLLTLSVNKNLTSNTLTGKSPTRGVIKVLSVRPVVTPPFCDPTLNASPGVDFLLGIRGWLTHIQKGSGSSFSTTDEELTDSSLGGAESDDLQEDCTVLIELGSGQGVCDCTDAGR